MCEYKQNIKAIENMHEYLEKIFVSFQALHQIFTQFQDDLYGLLNDLNFRPMSEQLVDTYNRMITFLYDQIKGTLSTTFISDDSKEISVIKPVRNNKYYHNLEITYFTKDVVVTKPLGSIATVSINKINDEIALLRSEHIFTFIIFDLKVQISNKEFREHIDNYLRSTKEIIHWFYSDIKSIKIYIKTLINIILELVKLSPSKYVNTWISLLEKIKTNVDVINKCTNE